MNTLQLVVLYAVLFVVSMGVACPATLWMIKFIRVKIATLFAIYTQTEDAGAQKWFYDQQATALDRLKVEWKWLFIPVFYWNQEKDPTPWKKKFSEAWKKNSSSPINKRVQSAWKAAWNDPRTPVIYLSEWELVPTNKNEGIVFGDQYILVRRSALGSLVGTLVSVLVLVAAAAFVLLIVQSTISRSSAMPTQEVSTPVVMTISAPTPMVVNTRTREQATASAQPTATVSATPSATPLVSNTPSRLVVLPGQTNMAPIQTPTPAPTAPRPLSYEYFLKWHGLLGIVVIIVLAVGCIFLFLETQKKDQQ